MRGIAALALAFAASAWAGGIGLEALPPEARETLALVKAGGPFPYARDGTVFRNREGLLPARPRGYYREYTVRTPGARDRGAPKRPDPGRARRRARLRSNERAVGATAVRWNSVRE